MFLVPNCVHYLYGYMYNLFCIKFRKLFQNYYNIIIPPPNNSVSVWPSMLLMCVAHTGFDLTGYGWLYSGLHGGCVATSVEVYSTWAHMPKVGFARVSVCLIYGRQTIISFLVLIDTYVYIIARIRLNPSPSQSLDK